MLTYFQIGIGENYEGGAGVHRIVTHERYVGAAYVLEPFECDWIKRKIVFDDNSFLESDLFPSKSRWILLGPHFAKYYLDHFSFIV